MQAAENPNLLLQNNHPFCPGTKSPADDMSLCQAYVTIVRYNRTALRNDMEKPAADVEKHRREAGLRQ